MADGALDINMKPTENISVRDVFGIDTDMVVKGFSDRSERVPDEDSTYKFDPDTTLAILAGFSHNRRVMIQGYHGGASAGTLAFCHSATAAPNLPNRTIFSPSPNSFGASILLTIFDN